MAYNPACYGVIFDNNQLHVSINNTHPPHLTTAQTIQEVQEHVREKKNDTRTVLFYHQSSVEVRKRILDPLKCPAKMSLKSSVEIQISLLNRLVRSGATL